MIRGAQPFTAMKAVIDELLSEATKSPGIETGSAQVQRFQCEARPRGRASMTGGAR